MHSLSPPKCERSKVGVPLGESTLPVFFFMLEEVQVSLLVEVSEGIGFIRPDEN